MQPSVRRKTQEEEEEEENSHLPLFKSKDREILQAWEPGGDV